MKKFNLRCLWVSTVIAMLAFQHMNADENLDQSGSPYFMVITEEGDFEQFPLKATTVDVNITGVIADVNVKQEYSNTGNSTIEAIYVFPASTRAAVYEMIMTIGEREVRAVVKEKGQARKMYDKAKKQGKVASLLEEEGPNVFKMKVANITPGAKVAVDMSYTELLVPNNKIYEFVYPTTIGPKYVSKAEVASGKSENWTGNPFTKKGDENKSKFDLKVHLNTSIPIQDMRSTSHKVSVAYSSKTDASMLLEEQGAANRDFIAQYRLAGDAIESGVMTYSHKDGEQFFMAMMQPPSQVKLEEIPPREYVFIVDVSGSMRGFPLGISKKIMQELLDGLKDTDVFNIVFFAGGSEVYAQKSVTATAENVKRAIQFVENQKGNGGTELLNALQTAMDLNASKGYSRSFVILTDGFVRVHERTFDYIRNHLGDANFFSFGIGSSVDRHLIEGIAHVGYGEPYIATDQSDAITEAEKFVKYVSNPSLTDIEFAFSNFEAYDVLPKKIPDLFSDRPLIVSGKFKGEAKGHITIKGLAGNQTYYHNASIVSERDGENKALKYLWAREKVRLLSDYDNLNYSHKKEQRDEIVKLGINYNLLTKYTSFIAIDKKIVNHGGQSDAVQQPLNLPKGVDPMFSSGGDIELMEELEMEDTEIDEETEIEIIDVGSDEEEEVDDALIYMVVETMPSFVGGDAAMIKFLSDSLKYPPKAIELEIEGRVYVSFVVAKDGRINDVKIGRSVHPLLDTEAIRVVQSMPKWNPGMQRGKPVAVKYMLPINFVLPKK